MSEDRSRVRHHTIHNYLGLSPYPDVRIVCCARSRSIWIHEKLLFQFESKTPICDIRYQNAVRLYSSGNGVYTTVNGNLNNLVYGTTNPSSAVNGACRSDVIGWWSFLVVLCKISSTTVHSFGSFHSIILSLYYLSCYLKWVVSTLRIMYIGGTSGKKSLFIFFYNSHKTLQ